MLKLTARREKCVTVTQKSPHSENFQNPADDQNFSQLTNDKVMTFDAALLIAQSLHIALRAENGKLILWCPGVVVPRDVNRVLRANTGEVLRLIGLAHVSVCPSPELHAHSWQYTVKRDCCDLCSRLDYWMDKCA